MSEEYQERSIEQLPIRQGISTSMDNLIDSHARSMGGDPTDPDGFALARELAAMELSHRVGFYLSLQIEKPD